MRFTLSLSTLGVVAIAAATSPPICPDGYILADGRCTLSAVPTCPEGYTFADGKCTLSSVPTCPEGYTFADGKCISSSQPTCPDRYEFQDGQCLPASDSALTACEQARDDCHAQSEHCEMEKATCTAQSEICKAQAAACEVASNALETKLGKCQAENDNLQGQVAKLTAQLAECNKKPAVPPAEASCPADNGKTQNIGGRNYKIYCNAGIWATVDKRQIRNTTPKSCAEACGRVPGCNSASCDRTGLCRLRSVKGAVTTTGLNGWTLAVAV